MYVCNFGNDFEVRNSNNCVRRLFYNPVLLVGNHFQIRAAINRLCTECIKDAERRCAKLFYSSITITKSMQN